MPAMSLRLIEKEAASVSEVEDLYRLRYTVFHERLKWDVSVSNGMEVDEYDELHPAYVVAQSADGTEKGCCRLLPTTGRYMLEETFRPLLYGVLPPKSSNIWEITRFAVLGNRKPPRYGVRKLPIYIMQEAYRFALQNGITSYVAVTTPAFERLLRRLGIDMQRFGPPLQFGVDKAVAFSIAITAKTRHALFQTDGFTRAEEY